ncbi:MAG: hypothetical protein D4R39_03315 [Methylophilaceae bacterium]|nr:MAG: hypothetical protein D4R39_03315 [Methylophilaceae bacterium]
MTDPYRYLALASTEKNIATLVQLFGDATALTESIGAIHNGGGAKILTRTSIFALANDVHLSWDFRLDPADVSVLSKIYLNSADLSWDEKYWKALQEDYPDSRERLVGLNFSLGPSPDKGETLGFRIFQLVADDTVVFDDSFRLLFIDPLWTSIALLP